jgi:hypothetical protein
VNAPTRQAMTNAAMTTSAATTITITRRISDRSAIWEGSLGAGVGIGAGEDSPGARAAAGFV